MMRHRIVWSWLIGVLILMAPCRGAADEDRLAATLTSGGHVLMLRHAYAPGTGDPAHFRIGDCSTQRNLNDEGRAQAAAIGDWLRERGIRQAQVFSSQWCRCLETAERLALGPVTPLPALNSFFERPQDRAPNLEALRGFLARQPVDGDPIILVTHFVTIAGLTGEGVSSGAGVVLKLTGDGGFQTEGRLSFGR